MIYQYRFSPFREGFFFTNMRICEVSRKQNHHKNFRIYSVYTGPSKLCCLFGITMVTIRHLGGWLPWCLSWYSKHKLGGTCTRVVANLCLLSDLKIPPLIKATFEKSRVFPEGTKVLKINIRYSNCSHIWALSRETLCTVWQQQRHQSPRSSVSPFDILYM